MIYDMVISILRQITSLPHLNTIINYYLQVFSVFISVVYARRPVADDQINERQTNQTINAVNKPLSFQHKSSNFRKTKFTDNQSPNIEIRLINYLARKLELTISQDKNIDKLIS